MAKTLSFKTISTRLRRIAELAREIQGEGLQTLAHNIDLDFLKEAYQRTRKDGAVGIDSQTAEEYAENLDANLSSLLSRLKQGSYRAPPVRRVHIPKGDGKTRPIGIPTFEDKVLQRAVAMIVGAVYEEEFYSFSYGFRPGKSAHQALTRLKDGIWEMKGGWILDVDIKGFFDTLDHKHLNDFLDKGIRDGVLRRVINKWLNAGVMEEGEWFDPLTGTPQGGVISPILANLYLHVVLDVWFTTQVLPGLKGKAFMVRYADDFVIVFKREDEARKVLSLLPERFGKYGLTLHPEKTKLVQFVRPPKYGNDRENKQGSFDFLGLTHYWGRSRNNNWCVKQKTAKSRLKRAIMKISEWCRKHRHDPVREQHKTLKAKLRGHRNYYGVRGNMKAVTAFLRATVKVWRKWLDRRSQRARMSWEKFKETLEPRYPLSVKRAK